MQIRHTAPPGRKTSSLRWVAGGAGHPTSAALLQEARVSMPVCLSRQNSSRWPFSRPACLFPPAGRSSRQPRASRSVPRRSGGRWLAQFLSRPQARPCRLATWGTQRAMDPRRSKARGHLSSPECLLRLAGTVSCGDSHSWYSPSARAVFAVFLDYSCPFSVKSFNMLYGKACGSAFRPELELTVAAHRQLNACEGPFAVIHATASSNGG